MRARTIFLILISIAIVLLFGSVSVLQMRPSPAVQEFRASSKVRGNLPSSSTRGAENAFVVTNRPTAKPDKKHRPLGDAEMKAMLERFRTQSEAAGVSTENPYLMSTLDALHLIKTECRRKEFNFPPVKAAMDRLGADMIPILKQTGADRQLKVEYLTIRPTQFLKGISDQVDQTNLTRQKEKRHGGSSSDSSNNENAPTPSPVDLHLQHLPGHELEEVEAEAVKHTFPERGTMLFFHGCTHTARDFCYPTKPSNCPKCVALPEEIRWVVEALRRGFSVVAVSSSNKMSHCWNSKGLYAKPSDPQAAAGSEASALQLQNEDLLSTLEVLYQEDIVGGGSLLPKPLIAMGASSGGSFVGQLPTLIGPQLQVIVPQIAAPKIRYDRMKSVATAYSLMERDKGSIQSAKGELRKWDKARLADPTGGKIPQVVVSVTPKQKIDQQFFFRRCVDGRIPASLSRDLATALAMNRFLTDENQGLDAPTEEETHPADKLLGKKIKYPTEGSAESSSAEEAAAAMDAAAAREFFKRPKTLEPAKYGFLVKDPRHSQWREVIKSVYQAWKAKQKELVKGLVPTLPPAFKGHRIPPDVLENHIPRPLPISAFAAPFDDLVADKSAISEALNVAYALHELNADEAPALMEFAMRWLLREN
jgi:hypothetical protein